MKLAVKVPNHLSPSKDVISIGKSVRKNEGKEIMETLTKYVDPK